LKEFEIKAINFSTYGASFVYLGKDGKPVAPLYNYLKKYPEALKKKFYETYGDEEEFSNRTASPMLGSLNSGMQLYRIKYEKPELFSNIKYALHLPQYFNFLFSGRALSDITSIGCHTNLWDFQKNDYHEWVAKEKILEKFAPIFPCNEVVSSILPANNYPVGVGLHDSSAALIPYLLNFRQPFVLISTGTWCISLNPFNNNSLTKEELANDCLCYMSYEGNPVKASRLFAGYEHEQQSKKIAEHFHQSLLKYRGMQFNAQIIEELKSKNNNLYANKQATSLLKNSLFEQREISSFATDEEAYHQLIYDIVTQQYASTQFILNGAAVERIFVDGGFSKNLIFMNLLATFFSDKEIYAASMAQATALGTALSIHEHWNKKSIPHNLIELKYYS
jgi:sugar (pentulose or hexulose) kinase